MCTTCQMKPDPDQLDACGEKYVQMLNQSAAVLMISIGYRTGLFETMRYLPPSPPDKIAQAAGLDERYVREWLGALTVAGVVTCDDSGAHYQLDPNWSPLMTDQPGAETLAHLAQYVPMLALVEDRIIDCFRDGGGVPYSAYLRFHELMEQDSGQTVVAALEEHILPLVPEIIPSLKKGIRVLDVGCGRGRALHTLAATYPKSSFVGYDIGAEAIDYAMDRARETGLKNVTFEARDLTDFHETAPENEFDFVTAFDAVHDQARPDHLLAGIRRALRPDGVFLMQDIGASSNVAENRNHPLGTLLYSLSCMHCMTVSLAQGGLGVGAMWGEAQAREFLAKAGFAPVERHTCEHDIQNYYYVARPGETSD